MRFWNAFFIALAALGLVSSGVFYNKYKHATRPVHAISVNREVLQEKLSKAPPEWMQSQIAKDLAPYKSGIKKEMLDQAFRGEKIARFHLVRFTITDGHISVAHDEKISVERHFKELVHFIKILNAQVKLPDVDFIVSLEDGFIDNPGLGPCFVFAKNELVGDLILVPDINAICGYDRIRKMVVQANQSRPWEEKIAKCFWRGSTTGGYSTLENWKALARAQLVLLSLQMPALIDARFHQVVQCDPGVPEYLKGRGMVGKSVARPDHMKYKYLADVDGNSCSFERYFWLLLSNSLVLKQMTPNVQWYYGGLKPYEHFVPVKADLSDLVEQIQWATEHDVDCEQMAETATRFVEDNLAPEDTVLYLYTLLKEYSRLLQK